VDIDEPNIRTLLSNSGGYNQTYIILKNDVDSTEYKGDFHRFVMNLFTL